MIANVECGFHETDNSDSVGVSFLQHLIYTGLQYLLAYLSQRLNVSYCDHWMFVVCHVPCGVNNYFKQHFLLSYWLDLDQTLQELS